MTRYRNISGTDLFVDTGEAGVRLVEADAVIDLDDVTRYVQTGETGEPALFEKLTGKITKLEEENE